jgi:TrmH family RNA methyltransferase
MVLTAGAAPWSAFYMPRSRSNPPLDRLRPVASRQNALVRQLRHAFRQGEAAEDGSVAVEGFKLVEEAIASGLRLRAVFVSRSGRERAERLLPQLPHSTEALLVPDEVFHSAVATGSPQGIAALVHPLGATLDELFQRATLAGEAPLILGCAGVQDPGNLGTILRSAEAFGASGVLTTEGTVSAANPKLARASAGSIFRLPLVRLSTGEAIEELRRHKLRLVVASSHRGRPVSEADLTAPTAIFVGNEGSGVPKQLIDAADEAVIIPHSPKVESLNAAIAASILLYEAQRQRKQ